MSGPPAVVFRVDAGAAIGSGHVVRCLTLADALRGRGAACRFVCRAHAGHMAGTIRERGYPVTLLPLAPDRPAEGYGAWLGAPWRRDARETLDALPADWLVVDHYGIGADWHGMVRAGRTGAARTGAARIAVIDDLADRALDCDLVLDQNFGRAAEDYRPLVPPGCAVLAGTGYALLRPEFAAARPAALARRREGRLERILITMGGVDAGNATGRALEALAGCALPAGAGATVVMGGAAPHGEAVRARAADLPFAVDIRTGVRDMAALMAACDLAVSAAGSTLWEMCCLGLPLVAAVTADNQRPAARRLEAAGLAPVVGETDDWRAAIFGAIRRPGWRVGVSARLAATVDGQGAYRVAKCVLGSSA